MQIPLAVLLALVTADEFIAGELGEVVLDLDRAVFGAQGPQEARDDGGLVTEPAVVVGLGEQTEERPLRGDADSGQRFGAEGFRLDGADACHAYRPAFACCWDGDAGVGAGVRTAASAVLLGIDVPQIRS